MGHNLWRAILGWMNIHLISTYFDVHQGFLGFDPQPHEHEDHER